MLPSLYVHVESYNGHEQFWDFRLVELDTSVIVSTASGGNVLWIILSHSECV